MTSAGFKCVKLLFPGTKPLARVRGGLARAFQEI